MATNSSSTGRGLLYVIVVIVVLVGGSWAWLRFGPLPVAVADAPFPLEKQMVKIAIRSRIGREMKAPPFGTSEDVFEAGAHIYREQCAMCHGTPGHDSPYAKHMFPAPPQLWKKHGTHGAVGVSEDEPGFSHWVIDNGIRLTGMPSFRHVLTEEQIWQVSLLLKNANQEMPDPVNKILNEPKP